MTRGFVTIATGSEWYYRIAANLLRSYRFFSASPLPFALICDRENQYSEQFDFTVHLEHPYCSYLDKLYLPDLVPFDETIFLDADSLAVRDLNDFWSAFRDGPDFSAFGKNYPLDFPYAWFKKDDVGEFADRISHLPDFVGGVYYLRKTQQLSEFSATCREILERYHEFRFRQFAEPADEPVFALAMALHGFKTAGARSLPVGFYPLAVHFKMDICTPLLIYDNRFDPKAGLISDGYMIHWGTGITRRAIYRTEEYKLRRITAGHKVGRLEKLLAGLWFRAALRIRRMGGKTLRALGLRK